MNEDVKSLFRAFEDLKRTQNLYNNIHFPAMIIKTFIEHENNKSYSEMLDEFKCRYIESEFEIEKAKENFERQGLSLVYDYIEQIDTSDHIAITDEVVNIHSILYSQGDYPEFGGEFRKIQTYLPGTCIELSAPENIIVDLCDLVDEMEELGELKEELIDKDPDKYIEYIKKAVRIKCELIRIHPFFDGNGRTSRAVLNLLFKSADLPPVYITPNENKEYRENMELALKEGDFKKIEYFYLYKICDSIAELNYGISTSQSFEKQIEICKEPEEYFGRKR